MRPQIETIEGSVADKVFALLDLRGQLRGDEIAELLDLDVSAVTSSIDMHIEAGRIEVERVVNPRSGRSVNAYRLVPAERRPPRLARWRSNDQLDEAIRRLYRETPRRGAVAEFSRANGVPYWFIKKRAALLGVVTPRKEPLWTEEEDALLERHGWRHPSYIRKLFARRGFRRSDAAIVMRRKLKRLTGGQGEYYSANALAQLLGVDSRTVCRWISTDELPARRRGTHRVAAQGGDSWWIARRPLRRWVAAHAQLIDLRKVDRFWFIDLLAGDASS